MPQMMPMMWLLIFFFSLLTLFTMIMQLYFFSLPNFSMNKYTKYIYKHNWTWKW